MNKTLKIIVSIICVLIVLVTILGIVLNIRIPVDIITINNNDIHLAWDSSLNLKQKGNTCSAHTAMAYIYIKTKKVLDPYMIYNSIPNKMKNGYVVPWSVIKILKENQIDTSIYIFGIMNDTKRKQWILSHLQNGNPVVLIVGNSKYLHYITILGYNSGMYNIYDSNQRSDLNKELEGNISLNEQALFKWWKDASYFGIHPNAAISDQ